ncbi:MAG: glycosyltransferase [Janthinobacterium lividum]
MNASPARVVRWTAAVGTVTSAIFCGLALTAAYRFHRRRRRSVESAPAFAPPISILKPLHGTEPALSSNLESFFQQSYPAPYEILFCARHADDAGLQVAREIASRYPRQPVRFLACGEPLYPNPKMFSLGVLKDAAAYDYLVTSDADCRVESDYLLRCVQSVAPSHTVDGKPVELAFCLYRGHVDRGSLFTHLDAMGKSVEMGSGVLIADMLSGTDFALGVTMILRKQTFDDAGGCEDLGHYWAEDFVLGNRLAGAGRGVEISTHVIRMVLSDVGVGRSFRDQLRWMQSTRRSRPWGHLGTGLTFAMPFGLLGFAVEAARGSWFSAGAFLAVALANRLVQACVVLRVLGEPRPLFYTLIYPLRDLLGFVVWCCSYLPADTRYHGTSFRIMADGRLLPTPSDKQTA